jgi:signal transduction histidine kinase
MAFITAVGVGGTNRGDRTHWVGTRDVSGGWVWGQPHPKDGVRCLSRFPNRGQTAEMSGWWPPSQWRWSSRGRLREHVLVLTGLVLFVGAVYVAVVIVGGLVVGRSDSPSPLLSVAATAVVAVAFEPARTRLRAWAHRMSGRPHPMPYDVLAHFTPESGASAQETPLWMAKVLAAGVGARRVQVWLLAGGRIRLAAVHPESDGEPPAPPELSDNQPPVPGRHVRFVRHSGELLGVLIVEEREGERLTPVEEELLDSLAAQAGLVLRNLGLTAELHDQLLEVSARADLLRTSRRRVVASEDVERQLLERDIHDGAQQQLVALAVNIRLVQRLMTRSPSQAGVLLESLDQSVQQAVADLLEVVGGRPRLLAQAGLTAALRAAAGTSPLPVELVSSGLGRYPADVELALYFCCTEALQNAAKHVAAHAVVIELHGDQRSVTASVRDDGQGFDMQRSSDGGLAHMAERIEGVGGSLSIRSDNRRGTTVRDEVPLAAWGSTP